MIIANSLQNAASKPPITSTFSILLPTAHSSNRRQVTAKMGCYDECVLVTASLSLYRLYDQGLSTLITLLNTAVAISEESRDRLVLLGRSTAEPLSLRAPYLLQRLTNTRRVACQRCLQDRSSHFTFKAVFLRIFSMSTHSENH